MKKYILTAVLPLLAISCVKDNLVEFNQDKETGLELIAYSAPETKIQIGDLKDGVYPILWKAGDNLGVYNCTDGAVMKNVKASLHSESDGMNSGIFVINEEYTLAPGQNDLIIYYPYDASAYTPAVEATETAAAVPEKTRIDYSAKTATNFLIPSSQKQADPNSSASVGKYSFAYALTSYQNADGAKPTFTMNHVNTYVKFTVSSTEFASYTLQSVGLADKSTTDPVALSGSLTVNMNDGTYTVANPLPYVTVTVENPATLATAQDVYMSVIPSDLTGKDVYVVVTMSDGQKTVTIPVELTGKELKANCLNIIKVEDVKLSDNKCEWFDPVETRYLAGGWCYGNANTIFSTYNDTKINFSVKAHGDFAGCVKPEKVVLSYAYSIDWPNNISFMTINEQTYTKDEVYVTNTTLSDAKKVSLNTDYSFDVTFGSTFKAAKASAGKIFLLDGSDNIIWAFNLWGCVNPINEIPLRSGIIIADKNIGGSEYALNQKSPHGGSFYFQWGRPFGFAWPAGIYSKSMTAATSLAYSAAHADTFLFYQGNSAAGTDWFVGQSGYRNRADRRDDLWGNPSPSDDTNTNIGVKSIYDPCPKGWMVVCPKAMEEIAAAVEYEINATDGHWVKYKYNDTDYVYFSFSGLKWGETGGNTNTNRINVCSTWTNSTTSTYSSTNQGGAMYWWQSPSGTCEDVVQKPVSNGRANGSPVRCMKDTQNL